MKPIYINNWDAWKELCEQNDVDPYEYVDLSIGRRGGDGSDSDHYEFIGDFPDKED